MNRYLLYCLLALFSLLLALPTTTAQRGLPAGPHFPTNQAALPAPAFSTTFFVPVTVASAGLPTPAPTAASQEASLARQALRELRLSWQFIKQQFRYEQ